MRNLILGVSLIIFVAVAAGVGFAEEDDIFKRHDEWFDKVQLAGANMYSKVAVNKANDTDSDVHEGGVIVTSMNCEPVSPDRARAILEGRPMPTEDGLYTIYDSLTGTKSVVLVGEVHIEGSLLIENGTVTIGGKELIGSEIAGYTTIYNSGSFSIGSLTNLNITNPLSSVDIGALRQRLANDVINRASVTNDGNSQAVLLINGVIQQPIVSDNSIGVCEGLGLRALEAQRRANVSDGGTYSVVGSMINTSRTAEYQEIVKP